MGFDSIISIGKTIAIAVGSLTAISLVFSFVALLYQYLNYIFSYFTYIGVGCGSIGLASTTLVLGINAMLFIWIIRHFLHK